MPEFKKSKGFQMKGFTYPGESPLKGIKRDMRKKGHMDRASSALEGSKTMGGAEYETSNILAGGPPSYHGSPVRENETETDDVETGDVETTDTDTTSFAEDAKALGANVLQAGLQAGISAGVSKLIAGKEKKTRDNRRAEAFSKVQFGRSGGGLV